MTASESTGHLTTEQVNDLLARHERMCWWVAKRAGRGLCEHDVEDLAAIVRNQFAFAARTYDPARGCQFGTYALPRAVLCARRAARRLRARGVRVPVDYDVPGVPGVYALGALAVPGDDTSEYGGFFAAPADELPPAPADVWGRVRRVLSGNHLLCTELRYRDDLSLEEIGRRIGRTKERVRQILQAAAARLRASGVLDGFADRVA